MMCDKTEKLPQAGPSQEDNPAIGSDRVKAPVAGAGCTDFGGSHSHSCGTAEVENLATVVRNATSEEKKIDALELRNAMFLTLGKKIVDLLEFVRSRNNVHGEIKRMVSTIRTCYDQLADMEKEIPGDRPETTLVNTQTSPSTKASAERASSTTVVASTQTSPGPQFDSEKKGPVKNRRERPKKKKTVPTTEVPSASNTSAVAPGDEHEKLLGWQVVTKRRVKPPKPRPSRADCIILKAKEGGPSYADMLKQMKGDPSLKEVGENVTKVRRNAVGNLLLELKKSSAVAQVSEAISRKWGESASIVAQRDEMTLEIRDLDELTVTGDVSDALGKMLDTGTGATTVKSIRKAYGGTQTAVVRLPVDLARKALEIGRVRIGWVNCRIRRKLDVQKCYRCWAFGHIARNCRGTDRTKCCLKCSEAGHTRANCKSEVAKCVLCTGGPNHPTGYFICPAYQAALKVANDRK